MENIDYSDTKASRRTRYTKYYRLVDKARVGSLKINDAYLN